LNTLQAQQGVLEQEVSKREFPSLQGEKGIRPFEVEKPLEKLRTDSTLCAETLQGVQRLRLL
jgi:hypothetical protein